VGVICILTGGKYTTKLKKHNTHHIICPGLKARAFTLLSPVNRGDVPPGTEGYMF
jgi:hypothetical protein